MTTTLETTSKSPSPEHTHLLLRALHTYLPYSLPLYRRLQFHLSHPNPPFAQVFDAFSPLSPLSKERLPAERWLSLASKQQGKAEQIPWICSHIDLSAAGQTQVWVFANWELPEIRAQEGTTAQDQLEARRQLLQALFETIYDRDVPLIPETGPKGFLRETKTQPGRKGVNVPFSRTRVLFGALNLCVRSLIPEASGERLDGAGTVHYLFPAAGGSSKVIMRVDEPYVKYLFPTQRSSHSDHGHEPRQEERNGTTEPEPESSSGALPPGYSFGPMPYQYLPLVLSRTSIPRAIDTMASFFSIGLFYNHDPTPVGWGFLGKDASLTSLHTEPEHRGKGLAVLLSKELFRHQNEHFRTSSTGDADQGGTHQAHQTEEEEEEVEEAEVLWAHADVSQDNVASRKVMAKIGGKVAWETCWIEVELESLVGRDGLWRALRAK